MDIAKAKRLLPFLILVFLLASTHYSQAERLREPYVGAKLGYSLHENACRDYAIECDNAGIAYGILAGYQWNEHWGLEWSASSLPETTGNYEWIVLEGHIFTSDLSLRYSHPLLNTNTRLYGKLGANYWDAEVSGGAYDLSDSGVQPTLAAGIEVPLSHRLNGRLEYQYMDSVGNDVMGHTHVHLVSLNITFGFPLHRRSPPPEPKPVSPAPQPQRAVPAQPSPEPEKIILSETINAPLFETDSSVMVDPSILEPLYNRLAENPDEKVLIIGHTDDRGPERYNQELSERRASAVGTWLKKRGVGTERITIQGAGESDPISSNNTPEGRAENRRVEFIIRSSQ